MSKADTPEQFPGNLKELANELDELVNFLADGPEVQQEMRLPQDHIATGANSSDLNKVPVLTAAVNLEQAVEAGLKFRSEFSPELNSDLDQLVDELVDQILPEIESELRRRLKTKISESNS
jgi:hypothetical protein|tara:strand:- start:26999 stop:27361 length:363 start_codon:yes stop_codon:yes gene_type:complete